MTTGLTPATQALIERVVLDALYEGKLPEAAPDVNGRPFPFHFQLDTTNGVRRLLITAPPRHTAFIILVWQTVADLNMGLQEPWQLDRFGDDNVLCLLISFKQEMACEY